MIVVFARELGRGVGERRRVEGRIIVELDVLGVTVHEADVVDSVVIGDVFVAEKVFLPGITPMNSPFSHHDGASGMLYIGEGCPLAVSAQEAIGRWIICVVTTIVNVTAVIEIRIRVMRVRIAIVFPTTVFGALKDIVI